MQDVEILKYAVTQGGLAALCIVIFFYARRDYLRREEDDRARENTYVAIIEKNTAAMTLIAESHAQLVQALVRDRR